MSTLPLLPDRPKWTPRFLEAAWTSIRLVAAFVTVGLLACSPPPPAESPAAKEGLAKEAPPSPVVDAAPPAVVEKESPPDFFDSTGLAREEDGKICFVSYAMALNAGMPMLLVDPGEKPSFLVARLGPQLAAPCSIGRNLDFDEVLKEKGLPTFYQVELLGPGQESPLPRTWIAVPGASPGALSMSEDHQPEGDLDGDGIKERFFYCNSYEGFHYSIRSIGAEKSRQRWHVYKYVDYEMEGSTCSEKDTEPVG